MELQSVPEHWRRFGARASAIANGPRLAVNPPNAVLNLSYRLLEAETRLALLVAGLDPGIGIWHVDQRGRDSLALDAMEAVRPEVDRFVLELFEGHVFARRHFVELSDGHCRVGPSLARLLANAMPRWAEAVAPVVEDVARILLASSGSNGRLATRLTQDNRSAGRDGLRRGARRRARTTVGRRPQEVCERCGAELEHAAGKLCGRCMQQRWSELAERFSAAGREALDRLRREGQDPARSAEAIAKQRATKERTLEADFAWNREHPEKPDAVVFRGELLRLLQGVSLAALARATGLSKSQCGQIRRGLKVPHSRHWEALRALGKGAASGD